MASGTSRILRCFGFLAGLESRRMVAQPRLAAVGGREIGDEVGESLHQLAQLVGQRGIVATEPRGERLALRFRHPRELGDEDLDSSVDRGATFGVAHPSAPPGSLSSAVAATHTISTTAFAAGHLSYSCQAPPAGGLVKGHPRRQA